VVGVFWNMDLMERMKGGGYGQNNNIQSGGGGGDKKRAARTHARTTNLTRRKKERKGKEHCKANKKKERAEREGEGSGEGRDQVLRYYSFLLGCPAVENKDRTDAALRRNRRRQHFVFTGDVLSCLALPCLALSYLVLSCLVTFRLAKMLVFVWYFVGTHDTKKQNTAKTRETQQNKTREEHTHKDKKTKKEHPQVARFLFLFSLAFWATNRPL
jgi:hypothetical protein